MAINWRALATGAVGAIGGLGAVSLAAQDDARRADPWNPVTQASNATDIAIRTPDGIWHISGGRLRYCQWNVTYRTVDCSNWQ